MNGSPHEHDRVPDARYCGLQRTGDGDVLTHEGPGCGSFEGSRKLKSACHREAVRGWWCGGRNPDDEGGQSKRLRDDRSGTCRC